MIAKASALVRASCVVEDALTDRIQKLLVSLEDLQKLSAVDTPMNSTSMEEITEQLGYYMNLKEKLKNALNEVKEIFRELHLTDRELDTIQNIHDNLESLKVGITTWHAYTQHDIDCIDEVLAEYRSKKNG